MYRHSLFVVDVETANDAQNNVYRWVGNLLDLYLTNDGESRNIEVRFFTEEKLDDDTITVLVQNIEHTVYAMNCDDGN